MLNKKIAIIILLISAIDSFGQVPNKFFEYGPKIGLNLCNIKPFDANVYKRKQLLEYHVGVYGRFNKGNFSLQPELLYQQKGGNFTTPQAKYVYKYISMPILLGYSPIKYVYFETGPEFNYALNKGYKKDGYTVFGPDTYFDNCWVVGARVNMLDLFSLASLSVRYSYGLTNVMTTANGSIPYDHRTRTLQVGMSFNFGEYYNWQKQHKAKKR